MRVCIVVHVRVGLCMCVYEYEFLSLYIKELTNLLLGQQVLFGVDTLTVTWSLMCFEKKTIYKVKYSVCVCMRVYMYVCVRVCVWARICVYIFSNGRFEVLSKSSTVRIINSVVKRGSYLTCNCLTYLTTRLWQK